MFVLLPVLLLELLLVLQLALVLELLLVLLLLALLLELRLELLLLALGEDSLHESCPSCPKLGRCNHRRLPGTTAEGQW